MSEVKCMARKIPVKIWVIRHIPNSEPKFHQFLMFRGVGKSTNEFLIILITGFSLRIFFTLNKRRSKGASVIFYNG